MGVGTFNQLTVTKAVHCVCTDTDVCGHHALIARRPVGGVYLTESMRRALLQTLAQLVRLFPEETRKILMRIKAEEALK